MFHRPTGSTLLRKTYSFHILSKHKFWYILQNKSQTIYLKTGNLRILLDYQKQKSLKIGFYVYLENVLSISQSLFLKWFSFSSF